MAKTIWLVDPKTKCIGMKSMLWACSEIPGLYPGDAWCKRYSEYKSGRSGAFIRPPSLGGFEHVEDTLDLVFGIYCNQY